LDWIDRHLSHLSTGAYTGFDSANGGAGHGNFDVEEHGFADTAAAEARQGTSRSPGGQLGPIEAGLRPGVQPGDGGVQFGDFQQVGDSQEHINITYKWPRACPAGGN